MVDEKMLVIGLGNPILGDDRVGWVVVENVQERLGKNGVDYAFLSVGGIRLMEHMAGYDRVIIVDAIITEGGKPGEIHSFPLAELPDPTGGHTTSVHDTSLMTALEMGRMMDVYIPEDVHVIGIEAHRVYDFAEELTPDVASAVNEAVDKVCALIK
ncbi:MAG: hydrogenase maturation protease [Anaerolineales bacterium]|nr:hydrogenase maturation protease [Anaerolineales bacterium]